MCRVDGHKKHPCWVSLSFQTDANPASSSHFLLVLNGDDRKQAVSSIPQPSGGKTMKVLDGNGIVAPVDKLLEHIGPLGTVSDAFTPARFVEAAHTSLRRARRIYESRRLKKGLFWKFPAPQLSTLLVDIRGWQQGTTILLENKSESENVGIMLHAFGFGNDIYSRPSLDETGTLCSHGWDSRSSYYLYDLREKYYHQKSNFANNEWYPSIIAVLANCFQDNYKWLSILEAPSTQPLLQITKHGEKVYIAPVDTCPQKLGNFLITCIMIAACSDTPTTGPINSWYDEVHKIYSRWLATLNDRIIINNQAEVEAATCEIIRNNVLAIAQFLSETAADCREDVRSQHIADVQRSLVFLHSAAKHTEGRSFSKALQSMANLTTNSRLPYWPNSETNNDEGDQVTGESIDSGSANTDNNTRGETGSEDSPETDPNKSSSDTDSQ